MHTNYDFVTTLLLFCGQVVACEDIIGWRDRGATGMDRGLTRIVLFMTDEGFHYAGEGQVRINYTHISEIVNSKKE